MAGGIHQERDRARLIWTLDPRKGRRLSKAACYHCTVYDCRHPFAPLAAENNVAALKQAWRLMSFKFVNKGDCLRFALRVCAREGKTILAQPNSATAAPPAATGGSPAAEKAEHPQLVALHQQVHLVQSAFDNLDTSRHCSRCTEAVSVCMNTAAELALT